MPGFVRILLLLFILIYLVSPYDLLPGWLDDLLLLGIYTFYQLKWAGGRSPQGNREKAGPQYRDSRETRNESGQRQNAGKAPPGKRDPHQVLEIERGASPEEIHAAYRRLAQAYHPDKVAHLGKDLRELANLKFIEIQEAYRQLADK